MNAVDTALNFANVVNLFAVLLLMRAVVKDRNILKGFSVSGSFLAFVAMLCFEIAFFLMDNFLSFVLGFIVLAFWLMVFVFSLRKLLGKCNYTQITLGYRLPIPMLPKPQTPALPPRPTPIEYKHALHVFLPRDKWVGQYTMWKELPILRALLSGLRQESSAYEETHLKISCLLPLLFFYRALASWSIF